MEEEGDMQGCTHAQNESYLNENRLQSADDDLLSSLSGTNIHFDDEYNLLECCYQDNCNLFELIREMSDETEQALTNKSVNGDIKTKLNVVDSLDVQFQCKAKTARDKQATKNAASGRKKYRTPATCSICHRTYTDPFNLRIHMMTHTGEKPYECERCGKRFRQYNKLKIHCVTHTNAKPHVCDLCGKGYRYANYLAIHRRLHTGEKPYKCTQCNEYFHSLHARRMHIKLQHIGANAGAHLSSSHASELDHINTTYTCPICGKVLTDQCYLTAHLKRLHYKERNHECEHCQKRFFSISELRHHQIAHTRIRKFKCEICAAHFLRKSNYKQHLKKVHKSDLSEKNIKK